MPVSLSENYRYCFLFEPSSLHSCVGSILACLIAFTILLLPCWGLVFCFNWVEELRATLIGNFFIFIYLILMLDL